MSGKDAIRGMSQQCQRGKTSGLRHNNNVNLMDLGERAMSMARTDHTQEAMGREGNITCIK